MNPDQFAATSHGKVAYQTSQGTGLPVLMIYGNSTCPDVFRNQLQGRIWQTHHCIAMDLPGHGHSNDANDPDQTYDIEIDGGAAV